MHISRYHNTAKYTAAALSLALMLLASGCGNEQQPQDGKLIAVASIQPYASLLAHMGGDRIQVLTLVPSGQNPHTFQLTPGKMQQLSSARLALINGANLEPWGDRIDELITERKGRVLRVSELHGYHDEHHGHDHEHNDPHYWLDPMAMTEVVDALEEALSALDPDAADGYKVRAAALKDSLSRLDADIAALLEGVREKHIIISHAGWAQFFDRYGLENIVVIEEMPGKEVSANKVAMLTDIIEAEGVTTAFGQMQTNSALLRSTAEETGCTVMYVDPLGTPETSLDYFELMRYNAAQFQQGLAR
ncbi:MAG: hypothetical protein CL946_07725 [Ectothiorhodospiraceae bacterium]|nr:hypothetical protein [Ectothiorhodospiraceae bacterium]